MYMYSTVSGVSLIMPLFCAIIGCANRGDRDKEKRFFRLPSVSAHQGGNSAPERREAWLARLKQADVKPESYPYVCVCSDHL